MGTPKDNTEVFRMLQDYKNAVSGTPLGFRKSPLFSNRTLSDTSAIAGRLNFSGLNATYDSMNSSSSTQADYPAGTLESMKRKLVSQEVSLLATQAKLKSKESIISGTEPANKKICIDLQLKLDESRRAKEANEERVIELTNRLKFVQSELLHTRSASTEMENKKMIEVNKLQMELLASQQECHNMKFNLAEVKSDRAETVRKLNSEIGRLELKLSAVSDDAQLSKDAIQSLKKQVSELTEQAAKSIGLQEELCEKQKQIKDLESKVVDIEESVMIVSSIKAELSNYRELKKENQLLKEELRKYKDNNVSLFQEKMWAFQEKLAQTEKKNLDLAKLKVENETLKSKIADWEALCDDKSSQGSKSPHSFSRKLSTYQKRELLLTDKVTKISCRSDKLESENSRLRANIEELKKTCDTAHQNSSGQESMVKRLKSRIFLLTKERNSCRQLIDSYVNETTMSGSFSNSEQHIKSLEGTLADYKKSLEKSDEEIQRLEKEVKSLSEREKELSAKKMGENTSDSLTPGGKTTEAPAATAHKNDPSPPGKIIHLRINPLDSAIQQHVADFKSLRDENDRLKKRVAILEEGGASVCDVTTKVEERLLSEGSDSSLQELREQLASSERQKSCIINAARQKAKEFREAIYRLTGYKVDMQTTTKYKLSHVFAESPDHFLMFEVDGEGLHLLDTQYSSQVSESIQTYLLTYDSIPAFLASVTLELFKQQTFVLANQTMS